MKRLIPLVLGLLIFCSAVPPVAKLGKRKMTDGVSALMPKDFELMSDEDLAFKYPSGKKPLAMYTSPDRNTDFGVNAHKSSMGSDDIKLVHQFYKATVLARYDTAILISDGVKTVKKRSYAYIEYVSRLAGVRKYNYIQYTVVGKYILIFNFATPIQYKDQWQSTAQSMMNSMKIKSKALKIPLDPKYERKGKSELEVIKNGGKPTPPKPDPNKTQTLPRNR